MDRMPSEPIQLLQRGNEVARALAADRIGMEVNLIAIGDVLEREFSTGREANEGFTRDGLTLLEGGLRKAKGGPQRDL